MEKYTSHFIWKGCVWEGVGDQTELQHIDPTLLAMTVFLSRFPGLLNREPGGPASLGAGFLYCILSPLVWSPNWLIGGLRAPSAGCWLSLLHLISNWLNFLCTELYNNSMPTFFLWASQIALIQPIHGQGYTLLFLDRMHLLFTQVHFLFWQPGRVVGQYTTHALCMCISFLILLSCYSPQVSTRHNITCPLWFSRLIVGLIILHPSWAALLTLWPLYKFFLGDFIWWQGNSPYI